MMDNRTTDMFDCDNCWEKSGVESFGELKFIWRHCLYASYGGLVYPDVLCPECYNKKVSAIKKTLYNLKTNEKNNQ